MICNCVLDFSLFISSGPRPPLNARDLAQNSKHALVHTSSSPPPARHGKPPLVHTVSNSSPPATRLPPACHPPATRPPLASLEVRQPPGPLVDTQESTRPLPAVRQLTDNGSWPAGLGSPRTNWVVHEQLINGCALALSLKLHAFGT